MFLRLITLAFGLANGVVAVEVACFSFRVGGVLRWALRGAVTMLDEEAGAVFGVACYGFHSSISVSISIHSCTICPQHYCHT